ncbi:MAG: ispZ [Solimicrobium sp.]|jgi:intracellular septation protein|nr:ispZ [Solimicrobium sp.]
MKILFDLFPVILFFVMFKWGEGHAAAAQYFLQTYLGSVISGGSASLEQSPIILATVVAIAATLAQIGYLLLRRKKIDGMLWMSLLIISVFGGLTIYFHNETFIKWKPTVLYWSYAVALIFSHFVLHKNLTRSFLKKLEEDLDIPELIWKKLNYAWIAFFFGMGCLNLLVAFNFSTDAWVNFKLFGSMILMFVFLSLQICYLSKFNRVTKRCHE